ncbi:Hypothetical protein BN2458_PEG1457 [Helicobacter typhlonius]|uniref:Uncharacterized protein n=1 Tax=Helicobacter typhlonius TaxID=76936 RepID=A0A0S4PY54_9HELI|nr:Hypothetical protein BN2458_PEG1457 [Helicobacter typhlonius]
MHLVCHKTSLKFVYIWSLQMPFSTLMLILIVLFDKNQTYKNIF